jgi:hypothetical protein
MRRSCQRLCWIVVALSASTLMLGDALAVVGRPATPGSVAGASRRTARRTVRRTAVITSSATVGEGAMQVALRGDDSPPARR